MTTGYYQSRRRAESRRDRDRHELHHEAWKTSTTLIFPYICRAGLPALTEVQNAAQQFDQPGEKAQKHSEIRVHLFRVREREQGEKGGRSDVDLLHGPEEYIHQASGETGVEPVLEGQTI